jgi:hypothetical protein
MDKRKEARRGGRYSTACFQQHEDVEGVAVLGERRGDEPEVKGEDRTGRQLLAEVEGAAIRVEREFVAATARRLDDGVDPPLAVNAGSRSSIPERYRA